MNPLALLLIAGGATAYYLYNLKKAGDELAVSIGNAGKGKMENGMLMLWAEIWYDNFTGVELHIMQPTVKVFLNDVSNEVGHVIPSNKVTVVPANGRNAEPCKVDFAIPLSNIVFAIPVLASGGVAGIKILVEVKATVNGIDYKTAKVYTL